MGMPVNPSQPAAPFALPGAIAGTSAWLGRDLRGREDWIYRFSDDDAKEVDNAIRVFRASRTPLAEISSATFPLGALAGVLSDVLRELLDGRGFVLIRGLPIEQYTREEQAIAYMGLGSYIGRPRSQNAKGHLLGHVKDLGYDINDSRVRYYQTNRKLEYHTDSVDIVGLLCLRPAKSGGESSILSSVTLFNEILARRPDLAPALFAPFPTDRRNEVPEGMLPWFDIPVFHWYEGYLSAIYARQYIESAQRRFPDARRLTGAQIEALDLLDHLANDPAIHLDMEFRTGDMQFLHNHQILHSRNDFENWPEPGRHRHLLRLWLCPANGRPLPAVFAQRYGSVTPGDRGGIVVKETMPTVPLDVD